MLASVLGFFVSSPVGKAFGLVLALSAWTAYHRVDAAMDAKGDCKQEQFERQVAEKERQLAVTEKIAQDARSRADTAEAEMLQLREAANEVFENTSPSCSVPDDVLQRLRTIR